MTSGEIDAVFGVGPSAPATKRGLSGVETAALTATAQVTFPALPLTLLALGMGALGGSMMPLEFYSPTLYAVAHITPHAWAADGFADLIRRDGGLGDVVNELGVLVAYGLVLFAAASWGLRRSIARA